MASSQTTWSLPPSLSSPPSLATPTAPTPSSNGGGALQWIMGVSDADAERAWSSFIGIVVAICGNILISLALNVQKYAHMRLEREARGPRWQLQRRRGRRKDSAASPIDEEDEDTPLLEVEVEDDHGDREDTNYISSPYWWTGLVMMFFGECGNFLAYGFAPASIVSPLGVVALVCNCVVAPLMLKEPFRKRDLFGVLVSIMGAVTVVWSAEKEETRLGPDEILLAIRQTAFIVYFAITVALIAVLIPLSSRYGHRNIAIDLGLVGLLGGYTVLSTKGISSLISSSFYHIFAYPIAYLFAFILVTTAIAQIKYLNRALQRFDSTQVIPTQFVLFTLSVIVGSAILYRDFETVGRQRLLRFCAGCLLTFLGVYLISSERDSSDDSPSGKSSPRHHRHHHHHDLDHDDEDDDAGSSTHQPYSDVPELDVYEAHEADEHPAPLTRTITPASIHHHALPSSSSKPRESHLSDLPTPPTTATAAAAGRPVLPGHTLSSVSSIAVSSSSRPQTPPPPPLPPQTRRSRASSTSDSPRTPGGSHIASSFIPGVMAGYQLHSALSRSTENSSSIWGEELAHSSGGGGGARGESAAAGGHGGRGRARSGSLGLMLGRLRGAWRSATEEAPWEREEREERERERSESTVTVAQGQAPEVRVQRPSTGEQDNNVAGEGHA